MNRDRWPSAPPLGPLDELRILAASLDGVAHCEALIDQDYERVWGFVRDVERSVPTLDHLVGSVLVTQRDESGRPTRVRLTSRRFGPLHHTMSVELSDGWCLMVSPVYVLGMAVERRGPECSVYGHLEGVSPVAPTLVRRALARPLGLLRHRHERHVLEAVGRAAEHLSGR